MANYRTLKGFDVKVVSSDPSPTFTGQMWYNSTDHKLRVAKNVGAWSAGGDVNNARGRSGNAGTQTASILAAGYSFSTSSNLDASEEYNGSAWSEGNEVNTAGRQNSCFGIQTAAVLAGRYTSTAVSNVEEYNGTSWSEVEDLPNEGKFGLASAGTLTAGLAWGGYILSPDTKVAETLEYDGTDWTDTSDTNATKQYAMGMGTQTAGLSAGGEGPATDQSEEYNGTGWTEGNNLNTARGNGGGAGTQTAGLIFGGVGEVGSTTVEDYDGTTWSTGTAMSITREGHHGCGTNTAALAASGTVTNNSNPANTEEYTFAAGTQDVTSS